MAVDGQHVCEWNKKPSQSSADWILWLQLKEKPSHAPPCVVFMLRQCSQSSKRCEFHCQLQENPSCTMSPDSRWTQLTSPSSTCVRCRCRFDRTWLAAAVNTHVCTLSSTPSLIAPNFFSPPHHGTHVRQETRRKPQQSRKCII